MLYIHQIGIAHHRYPLPLTHIYKHQTQANKHQFQSGFFDYP